MSNLEIEVERVKRVDELSFEPVCDKYRSVQYAYAAIFYALLAGAALLLLLADSPWWCVAAEAGIAVALVVNLVILREAYRFKGFALREHDITYRSGVVFPKTTTVPFAKIQQVSVSQNPVTRFYGMCSLDVVNGAQVFSSLVVCGLTRERAEEIKSVITQRLNNDYD